MKKATVLLTKSGGFQTAEKAPSTSLLRSHRTLMYEKYTAIPVTSRASYLVLFEQSGFVSKLKATVLLTKSGGFVLAGSEIPEIGS